MVRYGAGPTAAVHLLPREQRAECGSVKVPVTDAVVHRLHTGDTTMNKDIENTELTDLDLKNVTGGSLAGLGLAVSESLPGPGGPVMWFDWAHMWRRAEAP